jgi:hypothetical protein
MASPKEQHDARRKATVVGTSRPGRDAEPGAAHASGTGAESPASGASRPEPGAPEHGGPASTPRPADPEVKSSEEP